MRTTYLVSLNHKYQLPDRGPPFQAYASQEERAEFRDFISAAITRYAIRGIAEEMSSEALSLRCISGGSILCRFATELNLPYRACDVEPRAPNAQREQIWIRELLTFNTFPALFVLGATHIKSFTDLLIESRCQPFSIARDWKASCDSEPPPDTDGK